MAPDDVHCYWRYCLRIDPGVVPGGPAALAQALRFYDIAAAPRYIQKPAFQCKVIADQVTFGTSRWPFTLARPEAVDYSPERFPGTFAGLEQALVLPWNERMTDEHIDFLGTSISRGRGVAGGQVTVAPGAQTRSASASSAPAASPRRYADLLPSVRRRRSCVGVADVDGDAATAMAERPRLPGVRHRPTTLAGVEGLEAVVLCTPPVTHAELAERFADRGVHVLCEKPLAVNRHGGGGDGRHRRARPASCSRWPPSSASATTSTAPR